MVLNDASERTVAVVRERGDDPELTAGNALVHVPRPIERGVARKVAPVYLLLVPIPVVCFVGALGTDVGYSASAELMWLNFSEWLIAAGLAFGALAALALLVKFIASPAVRSGAAGWAHLVLFYAALAVELCNAFVHTIDGWTAVVPTGLTLSIVGAVLVLAAVAALFRIAVIWVGYREVQP
jgi:uncharacterized membrane protein